MESEYEGLYDDTGTVNSEQCAVDSGQHLTQAKWKETADA
jgi:hypothetical protein